MGNIINFLKTAGIWIGKYGPVIFEGLRRIFEGYRTYRELQATAREIAVAEIKKRVDDWFYTRLFGVFMQLLLLGGVLVAVELSGHHLIAQLIASITIIGIIIYNSYIFATRTFPDLKISLNNIRGGQGRIKAYIARTVLAYVLIDGSLVMLFVLLLALGTRFILSEGFNFVEPWMKLFSG